MMRSRWFVGFLCAILLFGVFAPAALAAEEPEDMPEFFPPADELYPVADEAEESMAAAEPAEPADDSSWEEPAEEPDFEEPQDEEEPVEFLPDGEEPDWEDTEEEAETEAPVEGDGELPVALVGDEFTGDPEDPLYWKYALGLDAAATMRWSDFTTRALNNETLHKGIDVSAWQSDINWSKVKASGVEFVFIRAAYRTTGSGTLNQDGRFVSYINGAKAVGLKVGVYIFSQAITIKEAQAEADYLLNLVKGYKIDLPLVFDLEHYAGGRFTNARLSKRAITDMCLAFCERIEAAGYESMVYSNPSTLSDNMYPNELGRLWLAHYTKKTSYSTRSYEYWQCSESGIIDGINGGVDLDFWFQPNAPTPVQVTPTPTPTPTPPFVPTAEQPFSDVPTSAWYYKTVLQAFKGGVVNGMTATTFEPASTASRGQVVTMLYRMAGKPSWSKAASFSDLKQDYYRDAVYWAAESGAVNGFSETSFKPDSAITREQLVTILYRLCGNPTSVKDLSGYKDASSIHSYAEQAMAWAVDNGIITGYSDGTLKPAANATRAEVCTILMRYSDLAASSSVDLSDAKPGAEE